MKDDGGSAFPVHPGITCDGQCGMTLRQLYKVAALAGMMTSIPTDDNTEWPYNGELDPINEIAKKTGEIADAMIAEDMLAAREGKDG